jgi:hypothetical protein
MKIALDRDGRPIEAKADMPAQATCPQCGGVVILRRRQRSRRAGDVAYFWRHRDRDDLGCPLRFLASSRVAPARKPDTHYPSEDPVRAAARR